MVKHSSFQAGYVPEQRFEKYNFKLKLKRGGYHLSEKIHEV